MLEWSNSASDRDFCLHMPPLPRLALIQFQKEILWPVGPPGVVRPSGVGVATLAPGGARVLFVVCQEWSCNIFSSDFSHCGSLSEYDHSLRVCFSVLVGCLGLREAFSLSLEVPFSSARGL